MILFLVASLATSPCEVVQDLNPSGAMYDWLDWSTLDADLRATSHLDGDQPTFTVVGQDKVFYIKSINGDTWESFIYDDTGAYSWQETEWSNPSNLSRWQSFHQVMFGPRFVRGGFPGMRWINCDSMLDVVKSCQKDHSHLLGGNIIHEIWGPYTIPTWGNIGTVDVLKNVYFWGCTGFTSDSCIDAEVNWYAQRYGWIRWGNYVKNAESQWTLEKAVEFFNLVPGTVLPQLPCDGVQ